jgi:CBS domain-containing protein
MSQIRDVMTPAPQAVAPSTSVRDAARLMAEEGVGPLPVVDEDRLVGIVTDRDLVLRVLAEDRDPDSTTVSEVASEEPVTVQPDDDIDRALRLMARHQVRRLPVIEAGRLVGIVTKADIAREAPADQTGEVVEEISR